MYPDNQNEPQPVEPHPESSPTPGPIPDPTPPSESTPSPESPTEPPKKSSGKVAIIVLACLSVLLTATVAFLAVRLANSSTPSSESENSDDSSDNSDEPCNCVGDGATDETSPEKIHNAANPTEEQLVDIYHEQIGDEPIVKGGDGGEYHLEMSDITVKKSPIAPYEYLSTNIGLIADNIEGGGGGGAWLGYFYRKDDTSDWIYSYHMGGHIPPMCDELDTKHEEKAFHGLTCFVLEDQTNLNSNKIEKTIGDN